MSVTNVEEIVTVLPLENIRHSESINMVVLNGRVLDGKTLKTIPLVALADVPEGGFFRWLIDTIRLWFGW